MITVIIQMTAKNLRGDLNILFKAVYLHEGLFKSICGFMVKNLVHLKNIQPFNY